MNIKIAFTKVLSNELIQLFDQKKFEVFCHDFIEVTTIQAPFEISTNEMVYTFTSQNAIHAFFVNNFPFPKHVYTIGNKTKEVAESHQLIVKQSANNATELAEKIIHENESNIVHFTSKIRLPHFEKKLVEASITYRPIEIYNKTFHPIPIESFDAVVFFSPSQVDSFLSVNTINTQKIFCIGQTTQSYLHSLNYSDVEVSEEQSLRGVVHSILKFYNQQ